MNHYLNKRVPMFSKDVTTPSLQCFSLPFQPKVRRRPSQKQEPDWAGPEGVPERAGKELPPTEGGAAAPHQQKDPSAL